MSSEPTKPRRFSATTDKQRDKDKFLQALVTYVNRVEGAFVEVTLQMGGLLISGNIIAGDKYFKKFAELFYGDLESLKDEPRLQEDFEIMVSAGDKYRREREHPGDNFPRPVYIHLEDCVIVAGHQASNYSVLWRGKIAQVDGFFLGKFPAAKKKQKPDDEKGE